MKKILLSFLFVCVAVFAFGAESLQAGAQKSLIPEIKAAEKKYKVPFSGSIQDYLTLCKKAVRENILRFFGYEHLILSLKESKRREELLGVAYKKRQALLAKYNELDNAINANSPFANYFIASGNDLTRLSDEDMDVFKGALNGIFPETMLCEADEYPIAGEIIFYIYLNDYLAMTVNCTKRDISLFSTKLIKAAMK